MDVVVSICFYSLYISSSCSETSTGSDSNIYGDMIRVSDYRDGTVAVVRVSPNHGVPHTGPSGVTMKLLIEIKPDATILYREVLFSVDGVRRFP